jgi:rhamnogalacturonan endolyase
MKSRPLPSLCLATAWQNVAYDQPPHSGFFLGDGMKPAPRPNITLVIARP